MNTSRTFAVLSRSSLAALLLASLAPVGCVASTDELGEDTAITDDAVTGGTVYTLQGVQSNKCVGISSGSTAAATTVDQWTCDGSAEQQWRLRDLGNSVYELKAQHSGQCLDVSSYSYSNGAKIQQWPCNNSGNESWKMTMKSNGSYQLMAQHSGKCLDVANYSTENGGILHQWDCVGGVNQTFWVNPVAGAPSGGTPGGTSGNPLAGSTFFVDPYNAAVTAEKNTRANGQSYEADMIKKISTTAQGVWIAEWSGDPQAAVSNVLNRVGGTVPILVAYNIPNRDCGNHSAGGAAGAAAYKAWIDGFAAGIGNARVVVILEPDALSLWADPNQSCSSLTPDLLTYAVSSLKSKPNAHVYIDAGTSRWNSDATMSAALKKAGIYSADGFALNTSYTAATGETTTFGKKLSDLLGGQVPFVIDTSRNGQGAPSNSEWCNAWGRGLGTPSTANTGDARIHALLWVKRPGESDGYCGGGPAAGQWFQGIAIDLAKNASF